MLFVVCVDNTHHGSALTNGAVYEAADAEHMTDMLVVKNNFSSHCYYHKRRFTELFSGDLLPLTKTFTCYVCKSSNTEEQYDENNLEVTCKNCNHSWVVTG